MKEIYTRCSPCGGTGIEFISTHVDGQNGKTDITCRTCNGTGLRSNLSLSDDLMDFLNDMNNKINDIFEKVNE